MYGSVCMWQHEKFSVILSWMVGWLSWQTVAENHILLFRFLLCLLGDPTELVAFIQPSRRSSIHSLVRSFTPLPDTSISVEYETVAKMAKTSSALFMLALATVGFGVSNGSVISTKQKLFGHSVKNGPLPANTEVTTFEHNCTTAPCTITQIHVPSIYPPKGESWMWTTGIISFYIDDDADASLDAATPTFSMTCLLYTSPSPRDRG